MSDTAAEDLSKHSGFCLSLNGLKDISDAAAKSFGRYRGRYLELNGLTEISLTAAGNLRKQPGKLQVNSPDVMTKSEATTGK